jgi:hypothetical protein
VQRPECRQSARPTAAVSPSEDLSGGAESVPVNLLGTECQSARYHSTERSGRRPRRQRTRVFD